MRWSGRSMTRWPRGRIPRGWGDLRASKWTQHSHLRAWAQVLEHRSIGQPSVRFITKKSHGMDGNEALLTQQLLDAMNQDNSDADAQGVDSDAFSSTLPLHGVVLDVKSNVASVSGLRQATIGSTISIFKATDGDEGEEARELICRGIVLYLEKRAVHVALFHDGNDPVALRAVQTGMHVQLDASELQIGASLARLKGRVVDPLGNPVPVEYVGAHAEDDLPGVHDSVPVTWSSRSVPSLMQRGPFRHHLATGILAIDCLKPLAKGFRFGIMGPRNSGKTKLTLDIIARTVQAYQQAGKEPPHFVYVSIGKMAARVQHMVEFLEQSGAMPYVTIVSASDRDSGIMQYLAPFTGCGIAEYFMHHLGDAVVVYDDLSTHTMVVENLITTMKLPKASRLSMSGHAVLMERSAQLLHPERSLTAFALADAPDTASGEVSEFQERMISMTDDHMVLEGRLALERVYPPVDVLLPGTSVRGPPFQSVLHWHLMNALRTKINMSYLTKLNTDTAHELGLEIEPEDAEVLEFRGLLRQFFTQQPLESMDEIVMELGLYFLNVLQIARLPPQLDLNAFLHAVKEHLEQDEVELLRVLRSHPKTERWTPLIERELARVFEQQLEKEQRAYRQRMREDTAFSSNSDPMRRALLYRRQRK